MDRETSDAPLNGLSSRMERMEKELKRLRDERAAWLHKYESASKRDISFDTISGRQVEPLYTPIDTGVSYDEYLEKVGFPGEYPFVRGPYTTMYRPRTERRRNRATRPPAPSDRPGWRLPSASISSAPARR